MRRLQIHCTASVITCVALSSLWAPAAAQTSGPVAIPPALVKLAEGVTVRVRLMETLVSGGKKKGEEVRFEVADDVLGPQREILIPRGAAAYGTVVRSSGRGMFGRPGRLEFTIAHTRAVDGTRVRLRATEAKRGRNNAGAAIGTAVLLFIPAVFVHGRDVTVEKGREFTAFVDQEVTIARNTLDGVPVNALPLVNSSGALVPVRVMVFQLRSGERIEGAIESFENGLYTVHTAYGTVHIAHAKVKSIKEKGRGS
jgi:hypothetical protein